MIWKPLCIFDILNLMKTWWLTVKLEFMLWNLLKSGLEFLVVYQMLFSFGHSHLKIWEVFVFLCLLWSFVNTGMLIWLFFIWVPADFLIWLSSFFKECRNCWHLLYLVSLQVARQELWPNIYLFIFFFVQWMEYISGSPVFH